MQGRKRKHGSVPGECHRSARTASGPDDSVEIDVVRHDVLRAVTEVYLDQVALPDANHRPGYSAIETPEVILYAVHQFPNVFLDEKMDHDLRGIFAGYLRRDIRGGTQNCLLDGFRSLGVEPRNIVAAPTINAVARRVLARLTSLKFFILFAVIFQSCLKRYLPGMTGKSARRFFY